MVYASYIYRSMQPTNPSPEDYYYLIFFLQVNGNLTNFPVNFDNKVFGNENGSHIVLETDFGLQMTFDPSIFSLTIPLAYAGMVGGLCGNANAIPSDDTSGLPIDLFLSTWSLNADNTTCVQVLHDDPSTPAFDVARKYCELLETGGPFTACHVLIDPPVIYHNCMSVNGTGDYLHSICQLLQYYNNECQWAGATVQPWKNKTLCREFAEIALSYAWLGWAFTNFLFLLYSI